MKYWECINIPGKTNNEGVSDTPSPEIENYTTPPAAVVGVIEPTNTDETHQSNDGVLSEEYINMVNAAFGKTSSDSSSCEMIEDTNDDESKESIDEVVSFTKTEPEQTYVSADDVDITDYVDSTTEDSNPTQTMPIDKEHLLSNILAGYDNNCGISYSPMDIPMVPGSSVEITEYNLDDNQLTKVIEALNRYEEKYFKEIPIVHISNRFLRSITKEVYRAHQDAVEKYEDPDLMDPLFLLYPLTTEDPYLAMGKFWDIVTKKISGDDEWSSIITKSASEYDEYMRELAEEEDDEVCEDTDAVNGESKE